MNFEEICKQKIINSSLFKSNSASLYDPNFDYNGFLCDVVKLINIPGLDPVLNKDDREPFYTQSQDFSLLSNVGDPRMPMGLFLSAAYVNFIPINLVRIESQSFISTQIIDGVICDKDGKPVKAQISNSYAKKSSTEKETFVRGLLDDPDFKAVYPQYDFYNSICLDNPEPLTIAQLEQPIHELTAIAELRAHSKDYNDLFSYSYAIDLPTCPLNFDNMVDTKIVAEDYRIYGKKLMEFGKTQQANYFVAFIKKFFSTWTITLHEKIMPPMFHIELLSEDRRKTIYLKYWNDDILRVSKILDIQKITKDIDSDISKSVFTSELARAIVDPIADYRKIMKSAKYQSLFYRYVLRYYRYNTPTVIVNASSQGGETILNLEDLLKRINSLESKIIKK